jgi:Cu(I)/Ag(I) efflux system membrane fusion protein
MKEISMLRKLITISILALLAAVLVLAGLTYRGRILAVFAKSPAASAAGGRKVLYWFAPMNPSYHSDHPGKSPMGMDLVPKYADDTAGQMPPGTINITSQRQQLIGVRTARVERTSLRRTIRTTGHLVADETKIAHIHVKVNGWIEKVYVDFVGQLVEKGEPLFTVYSPDLVATQQEYLIALKGEDYLGKAPYRQISQGAESLLSATRDRLKLWDISDAQIKNLEQTGKVERTMTFYSPVTGFVVDRAAYPQAAVNPDKELYRVADLSDIWVNADIYEYEIPYVHLGQTATMTLSYDPGKSYAGRVTYIYPTVDPQSRTVKVRLQFPNPEFELKPEMFADVELQVDYGTHLVVPTEAVLDSGSRKTVFVAQGDGYFSPRAVQLGPRVDNSYVVLSGLKPGEIIVTSGNFLIDSESRLNSAVQDMRPQPAAPSQHPHDKEPQ